MLSSPSREPFSQHSTFACLIGNAGVRAACCNACMQVGICQYVNAATAPFSATLKQRYADFQVNEVRQPMLAGLGLSSIFSLTT